jgi:hypothetical protein
MSQRVALEVANHLARRKPLRRMQFGYIYDPTALPPGISSNVLFKPSTPSRWQSLNIKRSVFCLVYGVPLVLPSADKKLASVQTPPTNPYRQSLILCGAFQSSVFISTSCWWSLPSKSFCSRSPLPSNHLC